MGILDGLVGIKELEKRVTEIERRLDRLEERHLTEADKDKERVLELLDDPKTTNELAKILGKKRSWVSKILNELERENRVKELGKKDRKDLYVGV